MVVKTNKNTWWITNTFRMFQLSPEYITQTANNVEKF